MMKQYAEELKSWTDDKIIKSLPRYRRDGNYITTTMIIMKQQTVYKIAELRNRNFQVVVMEKSRGYFDANTK